MCIYETKVALITHTHKGLICPLLQLAESTFRSQYGVVTTSQHDRQHPTDTLQCCTYGFVKFMGQCESASSGRIFDHEQRAVITHKPCESPGQTIYCWLRGAGLGRFLELLVGLPGAAMSHNSVWFAGRMIQGIAG